MNYISGEQSAITATDIFQKKAEVKSITNKVDLIKMGLKRKAAFSYQEPTTKTLTKINKKLKSEIHEHTAHIESSTSTPTPLMKQIFQSQSEIIIDETKSTPSLTGKYDCLICNKHFSTSASLCQHKKTFLHSNNL